MIDPAVIDLMHHMSKAPPALERQTDDAAWGASDFGRREAYVREIEQGIEAWIAETERRVASLTKSAPTHPAPNTILRLEQMIEAFEAAVPSEVAFYRRAVKRTLRTVKRVKATAPAKAALVAEQRRRILAALSAYGLARQDVMFALRALRAGMIEGGRNGPVFDDADKLEAYLLRAVA